MRWYVEPLAAEQRSFNDATLKLIDALFEELDRVSADRDTRGRLIAELEERLLRLERRARRFGCRRSPPSRPPRPSPTTSPSRAACAARPSSCASGQRPYVEDFRDAAPVLDAGCGRGEFLALLREAGVEARGVDADADMVAYARGEGLDVEQADLLAHLEAQPDECLGAIFAAQVVEHLPPPALAPLPRARAREAAPTAACSSPRRSTRSPRSRCATTSPT